MPSSIVTKFHICRECYSHHIEPLFRITSREPIAKQPDPAQARLQFEAQTMTTTLPRPETPRERAGREMRDKWFAFFNERCNKKKIGLLEGQDKAWSDLREQYIPRPTISDDELADILTDAFDEKCKRTSTFRDCRLAQAHAARKALTGEEKP
jgi:hypothetical protein